MTNEEAFEKDWETPTGLCGPYTFGKQTQSTGTGDS